MINDRPINIMLVEDYELTRTGVRALLETNPRFRVVAEAANMEKALGAAQHLDEAQYWDEAEDNVLDLVVTDLEMPVSAISGIELTKRIRTKFPAVRVLIYTMHDEDRYIVQAIEAGAHGYVDKKTPGSYLMDVINKIINGQTVFPPVKEPEKLLTPKEQQVLWLLGVAKSNEHIAEKLDIADRTVDVHRSSSLQKLRPILQVESSENELIKFYQCAMKYAERCPYPSK